MFGLPPLPSDAVFRALAAVRDAIFARDFDTGVEWVVKADPFTDFDPALGPPLPADADVALAAVFGADFDADLDADFAGVMVSRSLLSRWRTNVREIGREGRSPAAPGGSVGAGGNGCARDQAGEPLPAAVAAAADSDVGIRTMHRNPW
jgi:hypothetical protein